MPLPMPPIGNLRRRWRNRHYCNPFRSASHLQVGRVDMGVDYHGFGSIVAPGRCKVVGIGGQGWPGGVYLHLRLLRGTHRGRYVYIAEAIQPTVHVGQTVWKGKQVATFAAGAAPGAYPGIEIGWASEVTNETLAAKLGNTGGANHANSPAGVCFARFLHHHGAPAPDVPNREHGSEYPV